ncbi:zinc finger protein CONSTANS-LIKE 6-like [Pyrus ussuriensis x Pyrus communis]|uniref:Zinc finger protein CONSTANS-LIKE 6-like n=1 Tax=Pyrus ussuriensis x Pyrus communis TaxID=2448454 RepID=A0A5N5I471_9ROSA|nr:zinc finger protein CONSTANS-LIKE 6-like [Pyrus ussuriensis x Pyrus communis]
MVPHMITDKKAANAMGGNTARACDSCLVKRARWFCAADDAFLCQRCDASVHSANQLASRHQRVRLQGSSVKANASVQLIAEQAAPAWHKGFKRKARTPRHNKKPGFAAKDEQEKVGLHPPLPFVPEIGCQEANLMEDEENEDLERLLYRVPIYDPFAAELCNISSSDQVGNNTGAIDLDDEEIEVRNTGNDLDNFGGFLRSDMELAEFAADVENLLGGGLDEDCSDIKGVLGLLDEGKEVKVEEEVEGIEFNPSILDWNLYYDQSSAVPVLMGSEDKEEEEKLICLRLDYETVITAWASQGSPWTNGTRPELNPDDGWLDCMGMWPTGIPQPHGDTAGCVSGRGDDRGREARVSRYREKRRTRLFSKKIRYEVRKLNAEKRPRMKGRFVKRTTSSFGGVGSSSSNAPAAAFPYLMINK